MAACGKTPAQDEPAPTEQAEPEQNEDIVIFNDAILEARIREEMGKPEGDITLEEAAAVTKLSIDNSWPPPEEVITDISALKYFVNLKDLSVQFHGITDISPLSGLTNLTGLAIGGNHIKDISPLSNLKQLGFLCIFNCEASDYSPLADLTNLGTLYIGYSTIEDLSPLSGLIGLQDLSLNDCWASDVSPLVGLTNLKKLELSGCPIEDFTPLRAIYPNLETKDFALYLSLKDMGFGQVDDFYGYKTSEDVVIVRYQNIGPEENCPVMVIPDFSNENRFEVGYYPDEKRYVVSIVKDGIFLQRYNYSIEGKSAEFIYGEQQEAENLINEMLPEAMGTIDLLEAPIQLISDRLAVLFGTNANDIYALPYEIVEPDRSTLAGLGFTEKMEDNAYYFENKIGQYYNVEVRNPEWGEWEEGGDVSFFTPISDDYRIVVKYYGGENKFLVGGDDNFGGGAKYEYYYDTHEAIDGWCSDNSITVEQYFQNAYNDPNIEDIYLYPVELMIKYIYDTFGMSIEELYAMPAGEY